MTAVAGRSRSSSRSRYSSPSRSPARRRTVISELKRLRAEGAIDGPTYDARRAVYDDARSFARRLTQLAKLDLLVIDDFAISPMGPPERNDLLELLDDRIGSRSTTGR